MRAPTLLVISSDEEEEVRSGEIDITEINSQRSGHGYTEYTRRVTMTMRIFNDRTTNTRPPQQQQVIENTTRYEEYNNVEEEQRGEPKTTPPGGRISKIFDVTKCFALLPRAPGRPAGEKIIAQSGSTTRDYDRGSSCDNYGDTLRSSASSRNERWKQEDNRSIFSSSRAESRTEDHYGSRIATRSSSRMMEEHNLKSVEKPVILRPIKSVQHNTGSIPD
ncbi:uncharacterized protein LOC105664981 [Ceratitis capitata]|uniref:uncharacterized protein LOC105664981 n=1 Tax=Ceratitis capitata TaxID=7213 RepID=UPI0006188DDB|nr:uncharacterized protein LOC105664981 [Ceratitis capitata]